jgi:CRP-like cAMP-binding protein
MPSNLLLSVLPETERRRIASYCEIVTLEPHATLYEPDEPIPYVYFLESGVLSSVVHAYSGEAVEVALIGREGMAGLPLVFGVETSAMQILVQMGGRATRIAREPFVRVALEPGRPFCGALLKYANLYLSTIAQTAVCNRVHRIEQRLARWLLEMHDRTGTLELPMTHEVLALMLGAYRPSITNALKALAERGALQLSRGKITIIDEAAMQAEACECHDTIRRRTDATLNEIRRLAA